MIAALSPVRRDDSHCWLLRCIHPDPDPDPDMILEERSYDLHCCHFTVIPTSPQTKQEEEEEEQQQQQPHNNNNNTTTTITQTKTRLCPRPLKSSGHACPQKTSVVFQFLSTESQCDTPVHRKHDIHVHKKTSVIFLFAESQCEIPVNGKPM